MIYIMKSAEWFDGIINEMKEEQLCNSAQEVVYLQKSFSFELMSLKRLQHSQLILKKTQGMGNGLFARDDIKTGTLLLNIHESEFITYVCLKEHSFFWKLFDEPFEKIYTFAFFLACLSKSNYQQDLLIRQYLQHLPTSFHNLICWTDQELDVLHDNSLTLRIKQRKSILHQTFNSIKTLLTFQDKTQRQKYSSEESNEQEIKVQRRIRIRPEPSPIQENYRQIVKQITLQEVIGMVACIQSRNIYYQSCEDNDSKVGALIPLIEMFNHSHDSQCRVELAGTYYQVITQRPISKGEEVFVRYGQYEAEKYLEIYGMLPSQLFKEKTFLKTHFVQKREYLANCYNKLIE